MDLLNQYINDTFIKKPMGNQMTISTLPGFFEGRTQPKEVMCKWCGGFYAERKMIQTKVCDSKEIMCPECNKELHTCANCGSKVLKGEAFKKISTGSFIHIECGEE